MITILKDSIVFGKDNHYAKVLNTLVMDTRISPIAFRLMVIISNCNSKKFKPSIEGFAKQLNVNSKTIDSAVMQLKQYGYISVYDESVNDSKKHVVWNVHQIPLLPNEIKYMKPVKDKNADPKKRGQR